MRRNAVCIRAHPPPASRIPSGGSSLGRDGRAIAIYLQFPIPYQAHSAVGIRDINTFCILRSAPSPVSLAHSYNSFFSFCIYYFLFLLSLIISQIIPHCVFISLVGIGRNLRTLLRHLLIADPPDLGLCMHIFDLY